MPSQEPSPAHVLIVSDDGLLRELVAELLTCERFSVAEAGDLVAAAERARERVPRVVLLDAIVDGALAWPVLEDPAALFGDASPALVVLAGAGTPAEVRSHHLVDCTLPQPLTSEVLVGVIRHQATWRPRRQVQSGTRLRPELAETVEIEKKRAQ